MKMQNKLNYNEIIASFLPQHVANFKAKSKSEANKIAVAQHKQGKQYLKNLAVTEK
jgi:hypothetical protein